MAPAGEEPDCESADCICPDFTAPASAGCVEAWTRSASRPQASSIRRKALAPSSRTDWLRTPRHAPLRHRPTVRRQVIADQVARTPKTGMRVVQIKPGQGIEE